MTQPDTITVRAVEAYTPATAAGINALMPQLDPSFTNPMSEEHFNQFFKDSNERGILVAEQAGTILGTAVMSTMVEQTSDSFSGYMGGFVVDETARGSGAAIALWSTMKSWCRERNLPSFAFNTETDREAAIRFYQRMGATLVEGTDSHYTVLAAEGAVPDSVLYGFAGYQPASFEPLGEGLVNGTFLARAREGSSVLQRLNPAFDERLVQDTTVVTEHLAAYGWEVPVQLPAQNGELCLQDNEGFLWRCLSHIESDTARPEMPDATTLSEVGTLLGRWHQTMAKLDYEPSFSLPHFHDTEHHADQLRKNLAALPDEESRTFAENILAIYRELPELPNDAEQPLHGDPQLTNILFRDGKPLTYIDLDTIMRGPVWLDIGDLLRATLEDDLKAGRPIDTAKLRPIVEGYRLAARPEANPDTFYATAVTATQRICLELAMRFANDIVDDSYFAWDNNRFASRRDNHMHRAGWQWQIYTALQTSEVK